MTINEVAGGIACVNRDTAYTGSGNNRRDGCWICPELSITLVKQYY